MSSTNTQTSTPQKLYSAPGVANLPYHQRPLPPGWISQFDSTYQAYFYIGTVAQSLCTLGKFASEKNLFFSNSLII